MSALVTPVEAESLKWFFSSHADAAFGIKSPLGGQLERQKLRLGRPQTSPEFREVGASDRVFVASMKKRLEGAERACPGAARVLEAFYSPQDLPVLPLYWRLGRVMLLTEACGGAEEWQVRAADTAGRKGDREAAEWLRAIRREAEHFVADAERAFAATRPPPRPKDPDAPKERGPQGAALYPGRTDEAGRVIFSAPSARRAAGCGR